MAPGAPSSQQDSSEVTALIPVFNDWETVQLLLMQLDEACAKADLRLRVVLVNDGSTAPIPVPFFSAPPSRFTRVDLLDLNLNLGHQRALCVGLVYLQQHTPDNGVVLLMDADGEDSPWDIPALLAEYRRHGGTKIVFAARGRRAERFTFRMFYQLYRSVHWLLVGFDIRIGNFSVLPVPLLRRLTCSADLWNHYAAAVIKTRMPMSTVPLNREKRLSGKSQMNFVSLVTHGLSAMSVYSQVIGVRLMMTTLALMVASILALVGVAMLFFDRTNGVPIWTVATAGFLIMLLLQTLILSLFFTFGILSDRSIQPFIPVRDCPLFVSGIHPLYPATERYSVSTPQ